MAMSAALDVTRRLGIGPKTPKRSRAPLRKGSLPLGLQRLLGVDERIRMLERRHGYFPKVFAWRGQRYDVHGIERCWTISRRGIRRPVDRTGFLVRARRRAQGERSTERFEIYLNLRRNTWHLQRRTA